MKSPFKRNRMTVDTSDGTSTSFAAEAVDLGDKSSQRYMQEAVRQATRANKRAWKWHGRIGEIHYAVSRTARLAGFAELGVYELKADGTRGRKIKGSKKGGVSIEHRVMSMLQSPHGGTRGLIERFFLHMKVPGDSWLIRCRDDEGDPDGDPDGYDFVCAEEWERDSLLALSDPDSKVKTLQRRTQPGSEGRVQEILRDDVIGRVWRPSGMFLDVPDSPLHALDSTCEVLDLLTRGIKAKLGTRVLMNGVWYFPSEINEARTAAPAGKGEKLHDNKVLDQVLKSARFSALNPDDPMAPFPILVSGPGQHSDQLKFSNPDRDILEYEMKLRAELIDRVLFGLDINPQGVKGTTEANHWGAWAASDDEQRINVKPDLEVLCWALTRLVLYAEMKKAGIPDGRIAKRCIWYDLSKATAKTNLAEDGRQLYDRGLVGGEAARRMSGVDEEDKPSDDELVRMVGFEFGIPYLALWGHADADKIDWDKVVASKTGPKADSNAPESKVGPGKGDPGSPNKKDRKSDTPARKQPG